MKNILRIIFLLVFIISAGSSYSLSQQMSEPAQIEEESITLYTGETKIVSTNTPTRIIINNPAIIDVSSVSKEEIFIVGKAVGATSLVWWDNLGEHLLNLQVLSEDMNKVQQRVDSILKEMKLTTVFSRAVNSEGKVLVLGNVKTPQEIERINVALAPFKDKITNLIQVKEEESVVEIEVQVLELNQDASKTLGVSGPGAIGFAEAGSPGIASTGSKWEKLFKVLNFSRTAFNWTLDMLVQEGKARILSQPRLACQSGKEADLLVGGEKPIMTTSVGATGGEGTEVQYKEYGIKLKIKPTVTEEKKIKLGLNVEVSDVGTAETLGSASTPSARAYPLSKRSASTELFLNDGQTMSIGGLIKQKSSEDLRKVPFLADIPILGLFFRKRTTLSGGGAGERGDTELFLTLTPKIMKEGVIKTEAKVEIPPPPAPMAKEGVVAEESNIQQENEPKSSLTPTTISSMQEYIRAVSKRIRDNLDYPWAAKEADLQGVLRLGLHLDYNGRLLEVKIIESSGYSVLDENTLSIVKKVAPYPSFPPEINQNELWLDIPIVYNMK